MNILIVSGSRNPEGRTARAVNAVLEGGKEAGSDVELVFLPELNLDRCAGLLRQPLQDSVQNRL